MDQKDRPLIDAQDKNIAIILLTESTIYPNLFAIMSLSALYDATLSLIILKKKFYFKYDY